MTTDNTRGFEEKTVDIDSLIHITENSINHNWRWNDYHVRISVSRGRPQYYISGPGLKRKYAKKKDLDKVKKIIQLDYEKKVYKVLMILKSESLYNDVKSIELINDVYEKMHEARKALITPIIPSNESYIREWRESYPANRNFFYGEGIYVTNAGEKVRSKSEKIIADMLYLYGVPYQYEPEILLHDYKNCYPDFAVLNVRTRRTFLWEHLGLVSDPLYASKNMEKLCSYEVSGYEIGDNLIVTLESESIQLNVEIIENKIKKYLL